VIFGEHETRILSQPSPLVAPPFGTSPFARFSLNRPLAEFKILPLILFSYSLLIRDSHYDSPGFPVRQRGRRGAARLRALISCADIATSGNVVSS
jgi:hypothetical protein